MADPKAPPIPSQLNFSDDKPSVSGHVKDPYGSYQFPNPTPAGGKSGGGSWSGKDSEDEEDDAIGVSGGLTIPGFERISELLGWVTNPLFWKRLGIGALGFLVVFLSVVLIIASTKTGKRLAKTAAGAAVGGPAGAAVGAST